MNEYMPRVIDRVLEESLQAAGAVLIEGPKWCGKTRTAKEIAKSVLAMQDPDNSDAYEKLADTKPSLLLKGDCPRLLDEWQVAPVLWDAVRFAVDERNKTGQFILTGSAVPRDNQTKHTGTGRIARLLMRPMSLFESEDSNGTVSLKDVFSGKREIESSSTLTIEKIAATIVRGGWPYSIGEKPSISTKMATNYVDSVINEDISRVDNVGRNPTRVRLVMRSLARNISTMANISTIYNDILADDDTLSKNTIASYIDALRRIFVVEDLPAWSPLLRSKTALRTSPKRHFVDPSIATAVLRATPDSILEDFTSFGFLFESLCIRDLRIYAQMLDGEVFHYRDKSGLEADAIIHLNNGQWGAFEIKLGSKEIEKAAQNLIILRDKINTDRMKEPAFLAILTGTQYAYKRDDGVLIIPVGCLKP